VRVDRHSLDVTDYDSARELVRTLWDEQGAPVDAFVHSAGGTHRVGLLETNSREDIDAIFDVNAKAPIYWLRLLLPRMAANALAANDKKRAHVLFISSRSGERALPNLVVYAAAKAAVHRLLEGARTEYASRQIAFTSVSPGSVDTPFTAAWSQELRAAHNAESLLVSQAVDPIVAALDAAYGTNHVSYESLDQWTSEPGVLRHP
jgi:NAD(P)-dependent dehydrogenase (short-subunit alcohol dehydrogenase family)